MTTKPRALCPTCGTPLGPPKKGRPGGHMTGSRRCRAIAAQKDAERDGLVRVDPELSIKLSELGVPITYRLAPANERSTYKIEIEHNIQRAVAAVKDVERAPFVPCWAALAHDALTGLTLRTAETVLTTLGNREELREAVTALGALVEGKKDLRQKILGLLKGEGLL